MNYSPIVILVLCHCRIFAIDFKLTKVQESLCSCFNHESNILPYIIPKFLTKSMHDPSTPKP